MPGVSNVAGAGHVPNVGPHGGFSFRLAALARVSCPPQGPVRAARPTATPGNPDHWSGLWPVALDADILAARTAYFTNADYAEAQDLAKAKLFATACRKLLAVPLTRVAHGGRGGNETELDPTIIERQLQAAVQWIAASLAATSGAVVHADFDRFRE